MNRHHWHQLIVLVACAFLLTACGTTGPQRTEVKDFGMELYQQGDFFAAVPYLEQTVEESPSIMRLLALADAYRQLGEQVKVYGLLNHPMLSGSPERQVLAAQMSQEAGECDSALSDLQGTVIQNLSSKWQQPVWQIQATCGEATADHLLAAKARWHLSQRLAGEALMTEQDALVRTLMQVEDTLLIQQLADIENPEWRGWIEAAFIQFGADGESGEQWLQQWENHPASNYFLDNNAFQNRQKVAVLLPFSGRFEAVAKSVQKGLMAASLSQSRGTELLFFDTGSQGEALQAALYGAEDAGVDFIIGPLDKKSIAQLEQLPELTTPMLLLNQTESSYSQFTLSPEEEAADVAEKMIADGHRQALIMATNDAWGERMTLAFAQRFADLGGGVIKNQYFDAAVHDYSAQLQQMLGLVESRLRSKNLQNYLRLPLGSQEVVRSDVDAIFLAAQPNFARLMVPQLKFHRASGLPVYSSSHVFVGLENTQHNKDLEGVQFLVSPLQLQTGDLLEMLSFDVDRLNHVDLKLFALGYDALQLVSRLDWMQRFASGRISGLSGELSMDFDGQIRRQMQWAYYTGGEIYALED